MSEKFTIEENKLMFKPDEGDKYNITTKNINQVGDEFILWALEIRGRDGGRQRLQVHLQAGSAARLNGRAGVGV